MSDADWVMPDTPVLVFQEGNSRKGFSAMRVSTIKAVSPKTFTVQGVEKRFRLDTLATSRCGDDYNGYWVYRVLPANSDLARSMLREQAERRVRASALDGFRSLDTRRGVGVSSTEIDQVIALLAQWRDVVIEHERGAVGG